MNENALLINALGATVLTLLGQGILIYTGKRNGLHKIMASSFGMFAIPLSIIGIMYVADKLRTEIYQGTNVSILSSPDGPVALSFIVQTYL